MTTSVVVSAAVMIRLVVDGVVVVALVVVVCFDVEVSSVVDRAVASLVSVSA